MAESSNLRKLMGQLSEAHSVCCDIFFDKIETGTADKSDYDKLRTAVNAVRDAFSKMWASYSEDEMNGHFIFHMWEEPHSMGPYYWSFADAFEHAESALEAYEKELKTEK